MSDDFAEFPPQEDDPHQPLHDLCARFVEEMVTVWDKRFALPQDPLF